MAGEDETHEPLSDSEDDGKPRDGDVEIVQLNVRVPKESKEAAAAKLPHGGLTAAVRERIEEIAYGKSEAEQLREELWELRDERREMRAERDYLNDQLEMLDHRIDRVESRVAALEEERDDIVVESPETGR